MPALLVRNCEFACLKFGVTALFGSELGLSWMFMCGYVIQREVVDGIPMRQNYFIVCVCKIVLILQLQGRELWQVC